MLFLTDHFSFGMLKEWNMKFHVRTVDAANIQKLMNKDDWQVNFADSAMSALVSTELGFQFDNNVDIKLGAGDRLIVSSCTGFNLNNDAVNMPLTGDAEVVDLPENLKTSFLLVSAMVS